MYKSNKFCDILKINKGCVALIGSGGKTSLMYRLAEELSVDAKVIVCTSTHIMKPDNMPVVSDPEESERYLKPGRPVCIGKADADNPRKLEAPECGTEILTGYADYVLTEADGSKMRPLKCHRKTEPVIPQNCKDVILVVGLSGIGGAVNEKFHRPELLPELIPGFSQEHVTVELVAKVLTLELKNYVGCRVRIFLNQEDIPGGSEEAADLAREIRNRTASAEKALLDGIFAGSVREGYIYEL